MRTRVSKYFIARIKSFDLEGLREVKQIVLDEISSRNSMTENPAALGRLYSKLADGYYGIYRTDFESRLKWVSETFTEQEFSKWNGIGKATLLQAKKELEKRGLTFKIN